MNNNAYKGEAVSIKVLTREIVTNSEIVKNYKACREKAEKYGKIFIWKNSQPDAVLFSIERYKKLAPVLDYVENLSDEELGRFQDALHLKE